MNRADVKRKKRKTGEKHDRSRKTKTAMNAPSLPRLCVTLPLSADEVTLRRSPLMTATLRYSRGGAALPPRRGE